MSAEDAHRLTGVRSELAEFAAQQFQDSGNELFVLGHIFGMDRREEKSPFGHGSDETVAVSLLLRIGSQLISSACDLFADGRTYAASALLRQMVEVEYLAWAFANKDDDAQRWLRSTKEERQEFFKPAKLRRASGGKFRGQDYGYHCEFGGHPTPQSYALLNRDSEIARLMMSDLLGHAGNIWDHVVDWAITRDLECVRKRTYAMSTKFAHWRSTDPLVRLPPPP